MEGIAPPPLHLLHHDALGAIEAAARAQASAEGAHLPLVWSRARDPLFPSFNPYAATRLVRHVLEEALDEALRAAGALRGSVQLVDSDEGVLRIVAQRGFETPFLEHFAAVKPDQGPSGATWKGERRMQVEDVTDSPKFDARTVEVMLDAGARSVIASPLLSREGALLGVLSIHSERPRTLPRRDAERLDRIVRRVSERIDRLMTSFLAVPDPYKH
jgi:GAF domain-containing protein